MTTSEPEIILLRGAPAVGKSTLGKLLRITLPHGFVVDVDDIRSMINAVKWDNSAEHRKGLDATAALVNVYLEAGFAPAVIIDTFNPSQLRHIMTHFENRQVRIISLWASNDILEQRQINRERGYKLWEPTRILNEEVAKYRHPFEVMIDTTMMNKDEVLARFMELVKSQRHE